MTVPHLSGPASDLWVSEIFGPTIQGEGPGAGLSAIFLRLGFCNLRCGWCDTPYTWDATAYKLRRELTRTPINDVMTAVLELDASLVVVTGGEPLLQARQLLPVVEALSAAGRRVDFETAGTIFPGPLAALANRLVVSPKLANSGQSEARRLRWDVLHNFASLPNATFKFVATAPADLDEIEGIVARLQVNPDRVWVMPEGTTADAVMAGMRELAAPITSRGWALSSRLHILLWGDERGR